MAMTMTFEFTGAAVKKNSINVPGVCLLVLHETKLIIIRANSSINAIF